MHSSQGSPRLGAIQLIFRHTGKAKKMAGDFMLDVLQGHIVSFSGISKNNGRLSKAGSMVENVGQELRYLKPKRPVESFASFLRLATWKGIFLGMQQPILIIK